jgi:hypothetical protein
MARLPNCESAMLELRKLEDYCLDPAHPRGRHKARVLRQALGLTRDDAAWLRDTLLAAIRDADATAHQEDRMGTQWRADIPVARQGRSAVVRTIWLVRAGEDFPRFVTCWVR